LNGQLLC